MIIRESDDYEQIVPLHESNFTLSIGGIIDKSCAVNKGLYARKGTSEDEVLDIFYKCMPEYWKLLRDILDENFDESSFLKILESFRPNGIKFNADFSVTLMTSREIDYYDIQKLFTEWKFKTVKGNIGNCQYTFGIRYVTIDMQ